MRRSLSSLLLVLGIAMPLVAAPLAGHAVAAGPSAITLPPARVDADFDGIDDALEQALAERWAPVLYIEPDESNYPVNVDWLLQRNHLVYFEDCFPDVNEDVPGAPNPLGDQASLIGPPWAHPDSWGPGHDERHCGDPPHHRRITTIAPDPDGEVTGYSDQTTFYLPDVADRYKIGSTDPRDWVTYFHAYPTADGGVMIQYWHTYAYNDFGGPFDDHGGDWDASIQVQLGPDLALEGVWFSRHSDDHPGTFFTPDQLRFFQDTHPVVTTDGGGHAAYRSPHDWATCDCRAGESVTGPIGTVVWTYDSAPFDDPNALRKVDVVCDFGGGFPQCHTALSSDTAGAVWKTWTGGDVRVAGPFTHPLVRAVSAHGGLVNLGEYNPCTPLVCQGTRQASTLLAGEFHPLNDQIWIRYEGRWGSIGIENSGPRGPVFQGFDDGIYTSWYNQGADSPTDASSSPWRVPPVTTLTVGSPAVDAGGTTFVSPSTPFSVSASQNPIAAPYGQPRTFVRTFLQGTTPPPFAQVTGPFSLSGPDGTYEVDFYTLDGLNNTDAIRSRTFTLDGTGPHIVISQPQPVAYLHTATLTLDYTLTDASGVAGFTPTMDGATTLAGHGLASGQAIDLLTEMPAGAHTFAIDATDLLANRSSASVAFAVIVTADSIRDDVGLFQSRGSIRDQGIANSLLAKLNAAADARARGSCATAAQQYDAFIKELSAQSGKGVRADAARVMTADAQYLTAHCP